jgi:hypothetical protein
MSAGRLKLYLLLIGSPFLAYMLLSRGIGAIWLHPVGSSPTRFSAQEFVTKYDGQRWLQIDGSLVADEAWIGPHGERYSNVFVPVVAGSWEPHDPVSLVACFNVPASSAPSWPSEHAREQTQSLIGEIAPSGAWDYHRMFPRLNFTDRVVVFYVGQTPDAGTGKIDLGFGIFFALLPWPFLWIWFRRWRER